jgi:predicted DsbA family dithiol-disulfide isomerase
MEDIQSGTIALYGDIACPWAHLAGLRLMRWRHRLGLADKVRLDMRAFPLELVNERPTPKLTLDAEVPVVGALEPSAEWQVWQKESYEWPVTTLLALEAVQAAREQGQDAHERLAFGLRHALFAQSRCISLRHVILAVAREQGLDEAALARALDSGRARRTVMDQFHDHLNGPVKGSPHLFLPDGTDVHNPGIDLRWEGEPGIGFPVVDGDDESIYEDILKRVAA